MDDKQFPLSDEQLRSGKGRGETPCYQPACPRPALERLLADAITVMECRMAKRDGCTDCECMPATVKKLRTAITDPDLLRSLEG